MVDSRGIPDCDSFCFATADLDGGRGLSSALLNDLCTRLRGLGVEVLTRHLAFRDIPLGHAWRYDRRWRYLVRPCRALPEA